MHEIIEMLTVVTDVRGVSLSVCHAAQLGFIVQQWLNGSRWSEHSWGPRNIVLDGSPDPLHREGRGANSFTLARPPVGSHAKKS